jgi:hypothetical protein
MKMAQFGKEAHFMEKIRVTVSTFKIGWPTESNGGSLIGEQPINGWIRVRTPNNFISSGTETSNGLTVKSHEEAIIVEQYHAVIAANRSPQNLRVSHSKAQTTSHPYKEDKGEISMIKPFTFTLTLPYMTTLLRQITLREEKQDALPGTIVCNKDLPGNPWNHGWWSLVVLSPVLSWILFIGKIKNTLFNWWELLPLITIHNHHLAYFWELGAKI